MATKRHKKARRLLICFYGDDFTGSTDALESLSRAGIRTVLFTKAPTAAQLAEYPGLQAVGVAGTTRSMRVKEIKSKLRPALAALKALGPRHVHYKVCSTFDSSPEIGSIGAVIDLAWKIFKPRFVPLLVGAPALGRHCVFGHLFARTGMGSEPTRLDRHPTMSQHPTTPMDESDLRIHLGRQTEKHIALFDVLKLALQGREARSALERILSGDPEVVLFDMLYEAQLGRIGELMDSFADGKAPLFSVGSSGVGMALAEHWKCMGEIQPVKGWSAAGRAEPLLVMSGSCSPVTAAQIKVAVRYGFTEVALDTVGLAGGSAAIEENLIKAVVRHLQMGRSVVVHSSCGPDDPRVAATQEILAERRAPAPGELLGSFMGRIARGVLREVKLRRVCLAGGDTSSYAARALGIESMEMIGVMAPGAPLCRVRAPRSPADGLEMNFKGGQVGSVKYFGNVREGRAE
jgi:uncharacterized protein YgbK (DUF1537 family)